MDGESTTAGGRRNQDVASCAALPPLCGATDRNHPARSHASLEGLTPLAVAREAAVPRANLNKVRWVSHCRGLVQLPVAA